MKKIKKFMDKPVTWGGYLKLCLICLVIGIAEIMAVYEYYFGTVTNMVDNAKSKFDNLRNEGTKIDWNETEEDEA